MARSLKKPIYVDFNLLKAVFSQTNRQINTYSRRSTITPEMIGRIIGVYNGQKFIPVSITESLVNHKLGEFSPTRKAPVRKTDTKIK